MPKQDWRFYLATIINPINDQKCDFYPEGLLVIKSNKIHDLVPKNLGLKKYQNKITKKNTLDLKNSVILPGFYDMHFHWVQDDVRKMPKDSLLEWLVKHTFPQEMKYSNKKYAIKKAKFFFQRLIRTGTVGGACYSSIHEVALDSAMKYAKGNFVIGNVLMNMNSPLELTQSEKQSIQLTQKFIKKYGTKFCFTPRFALSTTPLVMKEGSRLADAKKCFKQSHLSETPQEIKAVLQTYKNFTNFKNCKSYTEIYQKVGMLGKKSLMGHAIHLSNKELQILKKTKTALIHCPTSNAPKSERGLNSGLFNFKKVEHFQIPWALGSDIGGGPYLSMFDVMQSFVFQNGKNKDATFTKALYRATLAGAQILGLGKTHGNLKKGKIADFVVVPVLSHKKNECAESFLKALISRYANQRDKYDQCLSHVFYQGKKIKD